MSPLAESRPVRVWLEQDGEPVLYEVSLSAPCSDLFTDRVDLREQTKRDKLSLPAIRTRLRGWIRQEPDVERVAVTYEAGHYTVAILANPLTRKIMTCLQVSFEKVLDAFHDCDPLVYVLGPNERSASMLYSPQCSMGRND